MYKLKSIYSRAILLLFYIPFICEYLLRRIYAQLQSFAFVITIKIAHKEWKMYWDCNSEQALKEKNT